MFYVIGMMFIKSIICFSGLIVYSKYFDCDPLSAGDIKAGDQILPYYILDVSNKLPGIGTVFIAGLIAVSLRYMFTGNQNKLLILTFFIVSFLVC